MIVAAAVLLTVAALSLALGLGFGLSSGALRHPASTVVVTRTDAFFLAQLTPNDDAALLAPTTMASSFSADQTAHTLSIASSDNGGRTSTSQILISEHFGYTLTRGSAGGELTGTLRAGGLSETFTVDASTGHPVGAPSDALQAAVRAFCASSMGAAVAVASGHLQNQGLDGRRYPLALPLHYFAAQCSRMTGSDHARSAVGGVETGDAGSQAQARFPVPTPAGIWIGSSCPYWTWFESNSVCYGPTGQLLSTDQCNNACVGMCGPNCLCWESICGDCCWHQGCYVHDTVSCGTTYFNWACITGEGCVWNTASGQWFDCC